MDAIEKGSPEELAAMFPVAHYVEVTEPPDQVDPTKTRFRVKVLVRPLSLIEATGLIVEIKPLLEGYDPTVPIMATVMAHVPEVLALAARATDKDGEWIGRLDAGESLNVLIHVVEANQNFLVTVADLAIGPTGRRLAAMFQAIMAGPTPSPSSPSTPASTPRVPLSSRRAHSTASLKPSTAPLVTPVPTQ
jgi:hypothetical protein